MPKYAVSRYKIYSGKSAALPSFQLYPDLLRKLQLLESIVIENPVNVSIGGPAPIARPRAREEAAAAFDGYEVMIELGIWLSGLESFLGDGSVLTSDAGKIEADIDFTREFRLTHSSLLRCARLNSTLLSLQLTRAEHNESEKPDNSFVTAAELDQLSTALRNCVILSDRITQADQSQVAFSEWKSWCNNLGSTFAGIPAVSKLIKFAEMAGEQFLPEAIRKSMRPTGESSAEAAELCVILPRFARILKWLSVIGKMLADDEPLKPALIIFHRVNEQICELTSYIDNRLERFPNSDSEVFLSLDAASYTATVELKKVYSTELAGLSRVRPSPTVYARVETAYSLLNEGFQQILASFAAVLGSNATVFSLFPNFQLKLEQSLVLRHELWGLVEVVSAAEKSPENKNIEELNQVLRAFTQKSVRYLFFKDTETVERFIEEILITKQSKDLVPILHRFGAYLETLFGQVNLRAVLAKHPFDPAKT